MRTFKQILQEGYSAAQTRAYNKMRNDDGHLDGVHSNSGNDLMFAGSEKVQKQIRQWVHMLKKYKQGDELKDAIVEKARNLYKEKYKKYMSVTGHNNKVNEMIDEQIAIALGK